MASWRLKGLVCLVVVLVATAGLFGAQDMGVSAMLSNDTGFFETGTLQTTSSADWRLENIGRQITDPARTPSPFQETHTRNIATLPAVPAAISMALCGFLCISFVRDRRPWLAMEAGILWLCQTGIQAVPELTHRICSRITTSTNSPAGLYRPDITVCPAGAAGQFIVFSPAIYIFTNLSRGPPAIEMRVFATKAQRAVSRNVF